MSGEDSDSETGGSLSLPVLVKSGIQVVKVSRITLEEIDQVSTAISDSSF